MVTVRPVSDGDRKQGKGDSEATVTLITKHYGTLSHVLSIPMHYGYTDSSSKNVWAKWKYK